MELGDFLASAQSMFSAYWREAVEPLHHFTWQTLSLFGMIFLLVALFLTALLHYSWFLSKPCVEGATIAGTSHGNSHCLRMSVDDHLRFHKVVTQPLTELAREVRAEDQAKYYVVTIVQTKPRRELIYKEMRLNAPPVGAAALRRGTIQLDARDLAEVRRRNFSEADNEADTPIDGVYNVYIREVQWYDIRHWLMHPNREVRILIWVTLITTTVPTVIQVLFG